MRNCNDDDVLPDGSIDYLKRETTHEEKLVFRVAIGEPCWVCGDLTQRGIKFNIELFSGSQTTLSNQQSDSE